MRRDSFTRLSIKLVDGDPALHSTLSRAYGKLTGLAFLTGSSKFNYCHSCQFKVLLGQHLLPEAVLSARFAWRNGSRGCCGMCKRACNG